MAVKVSQIDHLPVSKDFQSSHSFCFPLVFSDTTANPRSTISANRSMWVTYSENEREGICKLKNTDVLSKSNCFSG